MSPLLLLVSKRRWEPLPRNANLSTGTVTSNGSSNSDFWKDPGRQEPFGAVCINTIAKRYKFLNGLELANSSSVI